MTLNYQKMARFIVKLSWLLLNVELQKPSSVTCGRYFTTQTSSSWIYSFVNLFGNLKPFISKLSVSKYFFLTFFVIQFQFNSVWPTKTVLWNIYWILISLNVVEWNTLGLCSVCRTSMDGKNRLFFRNGPSNESNIRPHFFVLFSSNFLHYTSSYFAFSFAE